MPVAAEARRRRRRIDLTQGDRSGRCLGAPVQVVLEGERMAIEAHAVDVLVAGCGIGGLSAAVSALEEGASVAIIERAPQAERGGNTRYTEAYLRMQSETEVTADFESHFATDGGGYLDPVLVDSTK